MIELDQSDRETQDEMPPLEVSSDSINDNESGQKRLREETSEDENLHLLSKKICASDNESVSVKCKDEHIPEVNGIVEDIIKDIEDITNKEDIKNKLISKENTDDIIKETHDTKSEIENKKVFANNDITLTQENECETSMDNAQKDSISAKSVTNIDTESLLTQEEEKEDTIKQKKSHDKSQIDDAEVVEGLELSVECASDKESSSSSESEIKKDGKPIPKTIIVKAKPDDSELDVSSSEAEKSDLQDTFEVKSKQNLKKGKQKGRTSFSKAKNTDSEENNDNVSDEDYSPQTKKKLKKTMTNKKSIRSPSELKRGHSKAKKVTKKLLEKEDEEDEEDENSNVTEDIKTEEDLSDEELTKSKSENESDSEDTSKDEKRRTRPEDDKRIQLLKKYIRAAGIRVKSYNDLWAGCKSNAARVRCLKQLLEKNGINGRPTFEKCKKAKERNESLKDVAELNTSNIISEGRVTRAQRNKDSNKQVTKTPETFTKHRETRKTFKRVLSVVDSDSE